MSTKTEPGREPQANPRRTLLGKRLDEIRGRIKASGEPLLSWDEIEAELDRADSTQPEPPPDSVDGELLANMLPKTSEWPERAAAMRVTLSGQGYSDEGDYTRTFTREEAERLEESGQPEPPPDPSEARTSDEGSE